MIALALPLHHRAPGGRCAPSAHDSPWSRQVTLGTSKTGQGVVRTTAVETPPSATCPDSLEPITSNWASVATAWCRISTAGLSAVKTCSRISTRAAPPALARARSTSRCTRSVAEGTPRTCFHMERGRLGRAARRSQRRRPGEGNCQRPGCRVGEIDRHHHLKGRWLAQDRGAQDTGRGLRARRPPSFPSHRGVPARRSRPTCEPAAVRRSSSIAAIAGARRRSAPPRSAGARAPLPPGAPAAGPRLPLRVSPSRAPDAASRPRASPGGRRSESPATKPHPRSVASSTDFNVRSHIALPLAIRVGGHAHAHASAARGAAHMRVLGAGLEPARLTPELFKSPVSTDSTTRAFHRVAHRATVHKVRSHRRRSYA